MIIENQVIKSKDKGLVVLDKDVVTIRSVHIEGCRVGMEARRINLLDVYDSIIEGGGLALTQYAYGA